MNDWIEILGIVVISLGLSLLYLRYLLKKAKGAFENERYGIKWALNFLNSNLMRIVYYLLDSFV